MEFMGTGAIREVYEETTLHLPNLKFCFREGKIFFYLSRLPKSHKKYNIKLDFENDDYVWASLSDLDHLDTTPNCKNNILKCLLS